MTEQQQNTISPKSMWISAILIALAIAGMYLLLASRTTLWDRDEPRFSRATVEMVQSHNYLYPTFNGHLRPDKPIMIYWLMSLPVRLLGPTELACRFFGAVGTAISALLVFYIGKRLLSAEAGLWAMAILASTVMMMCIGTVGTADAVLMPFIIAVIAVFVHAFKPGRMHLSHILLMGLLLGGGILTKGPMGIFPVPVMVVTLWIARNSIVKPMRYLWQIGVALAIGCLIFMAWAIPANNATNGEFLRLFLGHHVFERATKPLEHHGGSIILYLPYYLLAIIWGFFPWTLHLPGAVSAVVGGRVGGHFGRRLLMAWFATIFVMMTLASTKLSHYILFTWPAMAVAVGGTIVAAKENTLTDRDKKWLRRGIWFFMPIAVGLILALVIGPWFLTISTLRWFGLAAGIILSIMSIAAIRFQLAGEPHTRAKVLIIGLLVFTIPVLCGVFPGVEQLKISPAIAQAVKSKTFEDTPVATYKFAEPTLNFYIGRKIEELREEDAVVAWVKQPGPRVLIIPSDVLNNIQQKYGPLTLEQIASKKGFNYSKGKTVEVLAVIHKAENK